MKNDRRIVAKAPDEIGGDEAHSELPEDYSGPAKLRYRGHRNGFKTVIFPSQAEANAAACMAIHPNIGGYSEVSVVVPEPGEAVTHVTALDWLTMENVQTDSSAACGQSRSTVVLDAMAFEEAVEALLSEWEDYFAEDPRGPIADNIETLLAPAIRAYLQATNLARQPDSFV